MTHDIHVLETWIRVVAVIASICTTSVPVLYSFLPWRIHRIGKLFMAQAISFAVAMDLTTLFAFWTPSDILVVFWVDAVVLTLIACSTAALTVATWSMRFLKRGT